MGAPITLAAETPEVEEHWNSGIWLRRIPTRAWLQNLLALLTPLMEIIQYSLP
jgi:hypothetical protein